MEVKICSRRPLSLIGSLINQLFIAIGSTDSKGKQSADFYNVHWAMEFILQIHNHCSMLQQANSFIIILDKNIYIAIWPLLSTGERAKQPCFQDGLSLEVINNGMDNGLCSHEKMM